VYSVRRRGFQRAAPRLEIGHAIAPEKRLTTSGPRCFARPERYTPSCARALDRIRRHTVVVHHIHTLALPDQYFLFIRTQAGARPKANGNR